ncbi:hypothetical protein GCM10007884_14060 [Methylobacterium brachythecii]|uniref:Uncharacterized protein n=1 Tax=Methylobacterium brachythecii TaxID=1176177 RepID=A0ABQ6D119_9HYPH|nr:hypothetical protein GCM10007884_14060 [Methylobacterium brachythecii]
MIAVTINGEAMAPFGVSAAVTRVGRGGAIKAWALGSVLMARTLSHSAHLTGAPQETVRL